MAKNSIVVLGLLLVAALLFGCVQNAQNNIQNNASNQINTSNQTNTSSNGPLLGATGPVGNSENGIVTMSQWKGSANGTCMPANILPANSSIRWTANVTDSDGVLSGNFSSDACLGSISGTDKGGVTEWRITGSSDNGISACSGSVAGTANYVNGTFEYYVGDTGMCNYNSFAGTCVDGCPS